MYIWRSWANTNNPAEPGVRINPPDGLPGGKPHSPHPEKEGPEFCRTFFIQELLVTRCLSDTGKTTTFAWFAGTDLEQMEDLTVEQVEAIHTRVMGEVKGDCRVLSEANLHQMVFHANLIPECIPRAAFIFYFLCAFPAFREGNSGTALAVSEQVLLSGGCRISGEKAGIMALAAGIVTFTREPQEIEQWLCNNTQSVSQ
jgi:hypothetical protein